MGDVTKIEMMTEIGIVKGAKISIRIRGIKAENVTERTLITKKRKKRRGRNPKMTIMTMRMRRRVRSTKDTMMSMKKNPAAKRVREPMKTKKESLVERSIRRVTKQA